MISIVDIVRNIIASSSTVVTVGDNGIDVPLRFEFGSDQYIKDVLDIYTQAQVEDKYPLVALFSPFQEDRSSKDYYSTANISFIIVCSSDKAWTNEEREEKSFINILRPIYQKIIENMKNDSRLDFGYDNIVRHKYTENYSYGRYGAYTQGGDELSEPIDAILVQDLHIRVKRLNNCRL